MNYITTFLICQVFTEIFFGNGKIFSSYVTLPSRQSDIQVNYRTSRCGSSPAYSLKPWGISSSRVKISIIPLSFRKIIRKPSSANSLKNCLQMPQGKVSPPPAFAIAIAENRTAPSETAFRNDYVTKKRALKQIGKAVFLRQEKL